MRRTGRLSLVTVLDENGRGESWTAPGAAAKKEKETSDLGVLLHRYIQIPQTFWTAVTAYAAGSVTRAQTDFPRA
ncbi:hypothetical protein QQM39_45655 [Streptomyces sp. DT2A-34]|uniref:hypothetical protein n=1 Tax=Streptomyces sp. DT2A-34 TaxID=3051182 RepID=UPI00265C5311|nr:hypothetical protein [Streptomyces sp. DT2A-34]MDO0917816.1 hypothetical protein [Streptomyces sp. DT2A-34]